MTLTAYQASDFNYISRWEMLFSDHFFFSYFTFYVISKRLLAKGALLELQIYVAQDSNQGLPRGSSAHPMQKVQERWDNKRKVIVY